MIFRLRKACKCKLSTNERLETSGIKLNLVLEKVDDKPKLQTTKTVVSSPYGGENGGQPDESENEQQQQQPANHSFDNTEMARCLTPFSHPGTEQFKAMTSCSTDKIGQQETDG